MLIIRTIIKIIGFGIIILGVILTSVIFYVLNDVPSIDTINPHHCYRDDGEIYGEKLEASNISPELIAMVKFENLSIRDRVALMMSRIMSRKMKSRSERDHHLRSLILAEVWLRQFSESQLVAYILNNAYFGNDCYGIDAASKAFFNKNASDLNKLEMAKLIAVLKSYTKYSIIDEPDQNLQRANLILKNVN